MNNVSNIYGYNRLPLQINILPPTNYVTIDTPQIITGAKTFTTNLICGQEVNTPIVVVSNYIQFSDGTTLATTANFVSTNTVQTITAQKTFSALTVKNGLTIQQGNQAATSTIAQVGSACIITNNPLGGSTDFFLFKNTGVQGRPLTLLADQANMEGNVSFAPSIAYGYGEVRNYNTMPATNDATTIVPTTAWVQGAMDAKRVLPAGVIELFAGAVAPSGYVLCNGAQYNKWLYPYGDLFAVIGHTYNPFPVDSAYTFYNVPDLRGVYPGMIGTNVTSSHKDSNFSSASFQGPSALGEFQYQSLPLVPHIHTADYPNNTANANYSVPGAPDRSFYQSGSSQENDTTAAQSATAPNVYTVISNYVKPMSLGLNYIIKL